MVLRVGLWGGHWRHMKGTSAFIKKSQGNLLATSIVWGHSKKAPTLKQRTSPHQTQSCQWFDHGLLKSPRLWAITCYLQATRSILVGQPKQTKPAWAHCDVRVRRLGIKWIKLRCMFTESLPRVWDNDSNNISHNNSDNYNIEWLLLTPLSQIMFK